MRSLKSMVIIMVLYLKLSETNLCNLFRALIWSAGREKRASTLDKRQAILPATGATHHRDGRVRNYEASSVAPIAVVLAA